MSKLSISAVEFAGLVNPVLPFASEDGYLPVLNAVRLFTLDGRLAAIATDRYQIGFQISDIKVEGEVDAVVPVKGLKAALRAFKSSRNFEVFIDLAFEEDTLTISGTTKDAWMPSQSFTLALEKAKFPNLVEVIAGAEKNTMVSTLSLDPKRLATFPPYSVFTVPENPNRPVIVKSMGKFVGLLMPLNGSKTDSDPAIEAYIKAAAK